MNKIREIRISKGLTQKELGYLCGMSDSQIRQYESGRVKPKINTLMRISEALNVSAIELDEELKNDIMTGVLCSFFNRDPDIELRDSILNNSFDTKLLPRETLEKMMQICEMLQQIPDFMGLSIISDGYRDDVHSIDLKTAKDGFVIDGSWPYHMNVKVIGSTYGDAYRKIQAMIPKEDYDDEK